MYPKRRVVASLIAALALSSAAAQAELSISYFDKRVYTPGADVFVKVSVRNGGPTPWRFKLADDKRRSIAFDVRTLSNRRLEPSETLRRVLASASPAYYRDVILQPGEEYAFVENVADYVSLSEPGAFVIVCSLFPELVGVTSGDTGVRSNTLSLSLRPGAVTPSIAESFRAGTAEILRAERIGPDEVVARTIRARQKGNWNEFFLYLDVERLLKANADKARSYDRESDDGRRRMIAAYRAELMSATVDADIVTVPSSFDIRETRYGPSYGRVATIQKFAYDGFSMIKEYVYELERRDDIWFIVSYVVQNKGTE